MQQLRAANGRPYEDMQTLGGQALHTDVVTASVWPPIKLPY